jgi:Zn-dependent protease
MYSMASGSYGIGRIFGIEIELHWTFIALMVLTLLLSPYAFILIALLFICVLIHELSHSVVALRNKVNVTKIVLLPIGGASIINDIEIDPKVEFNLAIAGPMMSLLLASIFGMAVAIFPPGVTSQTLNLLFEINVILGVFNLLPAFPTDGGRVFRSYLEKKYDEYKATVLTIKASKYVMAIYTIGTLVYVMLISAPFYYKEFVFLWNMLVVVFLYGGAESESELNELRMQTKEISIRDVISSHYKFVDSRKTVEELYGIVKKTKEHLLITKVGKDYAYVNLLRKEKLRSANTAGDITTKIPTLDLHSNIIDALEIMETNEIGLVAVTSRGKLIGIVTLPHLNTFISLHVLNKRRKRPG